MIEWLKMMFHHHKYEIIRNGVILDEKQPIGKWYDSRCSVCGKIKRVNVTC